jgi:hypothetical protein
MKPAFSKPMSRNSANAKLREIELAGAWAQETVVRDAANVGLIPPESPPSALIPENHTLASPAPVKPVKAITYLLNISAETNARLEAVIDRTPRASKRKLLMLAVEEYLTRVEHEYR